MQFFLKLFIFGIILTSCGDDSGLKQEFVQYTGPIMEMDSSELLYSDSAVVRVKVKGVKQYTFENGDREFPKGIFIEFYEPDGEISSTLEANTAYQFQDNGLYKAEGDVEVIGYLQPQKLNTEELYWDPAKEEIYTEQFVRIETEARISTGKGMVAQQDFSTFKILKPAGTIYLDETEEGDQDNDENNKSTSAKPKKKSSEKKVISNSSDELELRPRKIKEVQN